MDGCVVEYGSGAAAGLYPHPAPTDVEYMEEVSSMAEGGNISPPSKEVDRLDCTIPPWY